MNVEADHHLGVNIETRKDGSLKLTQSKLLNDIFTEFKEELPQSNNRRRVPLLPNPTSNDDTPYDRKHYLHLLGMLKLSSTEHGDLPRSIQIRPPYTWRF